MRRNKGFGFQMIRVLLAVLALLILLPILQTFLYSFSSIEDMKAYMKTSGNYDATVWMESNLSPKMFSLDQYWHILITDNTILRLFLNSVYYAVMILLGQMLIIPPMAYALSKFRFPGRDGIFFGIILLMVLPFQVTMVPNVLTLRQMGILNSPWAVIMPMWFAPFYIFLVRQFMVTLPDELIEAASIDGAGPFRAYLHILLPVCRPVLGAAAALSFADCWNLVEQPITYLANRKDLQPLSTLFNEIASERTGFEFAGAALYIMPALLIYLFFQEDILSGIQLTEMK